MIMRARTTRLTQTGVCLHFALLVRRNCQLSNAPCAFLCWRLQVVCDFVTKPGFVARVSLTKYRQSSPRAAMSGTTRAQAPRELKKPAVRGYPRSRALASQERSETPAGGSRPQASMRGQRSPSVQSNAGFKRKDRDFEPESAMGDTNIRVVVRCRGRSEREVKENSGVVVSTGGSTGSTVELSMGPNALGNKAYQFDKVFSPAADQAIVYDDVVMPIVNEVCNISFTKPYRRNVAHLLISNLCRCSLGTTVPFLPMVRREPGKRTRCQAI